MCLHKDCYYIEIIEIHDGVKLFIHYDRNRIPLFIQYSTKKIKMDFVENI